MKKKELKTFLDQKVQTYNQASFISSDPVSIPHLFTQKEDIEIAGFLVATFAWGNRKSILKNAHYLIELLEHQPYNFVLHHSHKDLKKLENFVHRTFNGTDLIYFIQALQHIYKNHDGLEMIFAKHHSPINMHSAIEKLNEIFFELPHLKRTEKHISNPAKKSACKRLHMFLRWMVRDDNNGVDFGIWKSISPSLLSCPLDVHSGRVARKLKLLSRKQNDLKAVNELDKNLRKLDPKDPAKYDFALFGLGVFEGF
ncbi:MAG: TIGR02757 family protein [Flavobacteriaceae bacterium]|nr:TIGR02757 family protein [Flavobacteriaceae bacterium]